MYRVEVRGTDYVAPDLATLQQWASEGRILPETLVWIEAEQNHRPASQILGLVVNPPAVQNFQRPPSYGESNYIRGDFGPAPPNHLVWAILTTVMCCVPFGIASIVYAARVDSLYNRGDYQGALEASNKAKTWAIASASVGLIFSCLYAILVFSAGGLNF